MAIGAATGQTADPIVSANNGHNMAADEARIAHLVQRDEAVTRATSAGKSGGARSSLVKYAYDHLCLSLGFVPISIVLHAKLRILYAHG